MTSSWVGPRQMGRPCRSLIRSSSGPYSCQRPDCYHSSEGCTTGIKTSCAPERYISSRTIRSTLRNSLSPSVIHVYSPEGNRRIRPERSIRCWLTTSASVVVSFKVVSKKQLERLRRVLNVYNGFKLTSYSTAVRGLGTGLSTG